ncbi:unnamed protein product [Leptidea sinapis]|uniref:Uncharacterized protein n=1 Tax=Leptidea sinapis TaxID=189913 RepID=A0A5E4QS29_9NEOP|nr:unnamed protein product [Leptidea sinapis]
MPRLEQPPEDFRRILREKALSHSLFYWKLGAGATPARAAGQALRHGQGLRHGQALRHGPPGSPRRLSDSSVERAPPTARPRPAQPRVSELLKRFEAGPMQYLRPPRAASPDDISSSDDDDRAAVRRRSRDLSDDSAVELEPRRRHSHPRDLTPPADAVSPRRERTLIEANVIELDRRGSEGCETRARCVRTPSVVVSDYSDGVAVGATQEEVDWLRSRSLSADSACSSCSTLSSREDDEFESPPMPKKMINAE